MATIELTSENFNEVIENNKIVIIDFWAEWCGPCKQFAPIFEKVSEEYDDVAFVKVNTEEQQELAGHFNIQSIPTVIIFKEGIGIFQQPGMLPEEALKDIITQVKELNMDEVRAEIEKEQQEANNN